MQRITRNPAAMVAMLASVLAAAVGAFADEQSDRAALADRLLPFIELARGEAAAFEVETQIEVGDERAVVRLAKRDGESFAFAVEHEKYPFRLDRSATRTQLHLPNHDRVLLGEGAVEAAHRLSPDGLTGRLIGPTTRISQMQTILAGGADAEVTAHRAAQALSMLTDLQREGEAVWRSEAGGIAVTFDEEGRLAVEGEGWQVAFAMREPGDWAADVPAAGDVQVVEIDRAEMERLIARGLRRATEVLAPSGRLTQPERDVRQAAHGQLRWVEDQRVAMLWGTPEQRGRAHGELLAAEAQRCADSALYLVGMVDTVRTGEWFLDRLRAARQRVDPFIPQAHKREMNALADAAGMSREEVRLANVFPELFHCSGFAVFGEATADGTLYHGRVLDYMTMIGLQDAATVFVVEPDEGLAFANVGYAGFTGSVTGMNEAQVSLGEMGGEGAGQWDGVPMATLMRQALEECETLDAVVDLWETSPRTCEYYYVFADGKGPDAVGVHATPDEIIFVGPGESHPRLGEGIEDAVILSAGDRLAELRRRVQADYGEIDAQKAIDLMARPVAMNSNLHNVLMVPAEGVFYVAHADHQHKADARPYHRFDLHAWLDRLNAAKQRETSPLSAQ